MNGLAFRRLARADFPLLRAWLAQPHVARWWNHETSAAAVEADFGPAIDGTDRAEIFVVLAKAHPVGLLQRYTFGDNPEYIDELAPLVAAPAEALSLDYFIGEPKALRQGFGQAMIRAALADLWRAYPSAPCVIVPVCAANTASWRTLERAGFRRVAEGPLPPDNPIDDPHHLVYRIDRLPQPAPSRLKAAERPLGGQERSDVGA